MAGIRLQQIGKRFNEHWLFRNLSTDISHGEKVGITGKNGSGKSTFLHIISGFLRPTEGTIQMVVNNAPVSADDYYHHFSWAAPYVELIEEFTAAEFVRFYIKHKPLLKGFSAQDLLALSYLHDSTDQHIKNFSSGMKQRLKLATALLSDTTLVLLDEPLSNLDEEGIRFYRRMIAEYTENRTVIVCSNNAENEIYFCNRTINIESFQ